MPGTWPWPSFSPWGWRWFATFSWWAILSGVAWPRITRFHQITAHNIHKATFPLERIWRTVYTGGAWRGVKDKVCCSHTHAAPAWQDSSLLLASQGDYSGLYYHAFTEYLVLTYYFLKNKIMVWPYMQHSVSSINVSCPFSCFNTAVHSFSPLSPLSTQGTQAHCYVDMSEIPMPFGGATTMYLTFT